MVLLSRHFPSLLGGQRRCAAPIVLLLLSSTAAVVAYAAPPDSNRASTAPGPRASDQQDQLPRTGPAVEFETEMFDFGRVPAGTAVEHTFRFRNTGSATLRILKLRTTCGCTTAGAHDTEVAPGQTGIIPLVLKTVRYSGRITKSINVTFNDPRRRQVQLRISGETWLPVTIQPAAADFGTLADDAPRSRLLRIVNNLERPLKLNKLSCSNEAFRVELQTVKPGYDYQLKVSLADSVPEGMHVGEVTIETDAEEMPVVRIALRARRLPPVTVSPQVLFVNCDETKVQRKYILVRHTEKKPLEIRDLQVSGNQLQVVLDEAPQWKKLNMQRLILTIPQGYVPDAMGERVTFKTDEQAAPEFTVRILGRASSLARGAARSAPRNDSEVSSVAVQAMARYIGRFDRDGDSALNQSEWSKLPRDYAYADLNGDDKITASEFVRAMKRGPPEAGGQRSR